MKCLKMKSKKIVGVFRGFPGLGRVVAGVSLLEELRDLYGFEIKLFSYLQGQDYLASRGYKQDCFAENADVSSIGLVPTHKIGVEMLREIKNFQPDLLLIDGEPLMLQSIKILFPHLTTIVLLNPSDVDNPANDPESMAFFNHFYEMADFAIIHGLRDITSSLAKKRMMSIPTIIRNEILSICNIPQPKIYCILGGGTVNVGTDFELNTLEIGKLCIETARILDGFEFSILCSCEKIAKQIYTLNIPENVLVHSSIKEAKEYYSDASIVITRSGRNTLSELAYLGIPAITFISGDTFRKEEQRRNIEDLNVDNILCKEIDITPIELSTLITDLVPNRNQHRCFEPGNSQAISQILSIYNDI